MTPKPERKVCLGEKRFSPLLETLASCGLLWRPLWCAPPGIVAKTSRTLAKLPQQAPAQKKYLFWTCTLVLRHLIATESQKLSDCEPEKLPA